LEPLAVLPRLHGVGVSLSALNILALLDEIFLQVMQHIQDIWIFLMASEQTTALRELGQ
jgi:hypothetical protein